MHALQVWPSILLCWKENWAVPQRCWTVARPESAALMACVSSVGVMLPVPVVNSNVPSEGIEERVGMLARVMWLAGRRRVFTVGCPAVVAMEESVKATPSRSMFRSLDMSRRALQTWVASASVSWFPRVRWMLLNARSTESYVSFNETGMSVERKEKE